VKHGESTTELMQETDQAGPAGDAICSGKVGIQE
jgi:hypothetical protein